MYIFLKQKISYCFWFSSDRSYFVLPGNEQPNHQNMNRWVNPAWRTASRSGHNQNFGSRISCQPKYDACVLSENKEQRTLFVLKRKLFQSRMTESYCNFFLFFNWHSSHDQKLQYICSNQHTTCIQKPFWEKQAKKKNTTHKEGYILSSSFAWVQSRDNGSLGIKKECDGWHSICHWKITKIYAQEIKEENRNGVASSPRTDTEIFMSISVQLKSYQYKTLQRFIAYTLTVRELVSHVSWTRYTAYCSPQTA